MAANEPVDLEGLIGRAITALNRLSIAFKRRTLYLGIAIMVLIAVCVYVSIQSNHNADQVRIARRETTAARKALEEYKTKTQEARVNSCKQDVIKAKEQGKIEKDNERARREQSPEAKALTADILKRLGITHEQVDRFNAQQLAHFDAQVDKAHKLRDCTAKGIANYLSFNGGYLPVTTTTTPAKP